MIVVGNKIDRSDEEREVNLDDVVSYITQNEQLRVKIVLETSAKENTNVDQLFKAMLNAIPLPNTKPRTNSLFVDGVEVDINQKKQNRKCACN